MYNIQFVLSYSFARRRIVCNTEYTRQRDRSIPVLLLPEGDLYDVSISTILI